MSETQVKKQLPKGIGVQIAEALGTDRIYVSQVLRDPENNNGKVAQKIKQAYAHILQQQEQLKAAFQEDSSPVNS